jgi:hypothetical protein
MNTQNQISPYVLRFPFYLQFSWMLVVGCWDFSSHAATVTGSLTDISVQPLTTKMLFTPTTNVLVTGSGLSAGPPKMITTSSGTFSLDLEAGDYTVSLPLITYRAPLVALSGLDLLPSARRFCTNTNAGPFDRTPLLRTPNSAFRTPHCPAPRQTPNHSLLSCYVEEGTLLGDSGAAGDHRRAGGHHPIEG